MKNVHLAQSTPAATLLGREVLRVDDDGVAHLRFFARPEFANRHGTVQGGLVGAMLDSATMTPLLAQLPEERIALTVKLETEFLRPAPLGELHARALADDPQRAPGDSARRAARPRRHRRRHRDRTSAHPAASALIVAARRSLQRSAVAAFFP